MKHVLQMKLKHSLIVAEINSRVKDKRQDQSRNQHMSRYVSILSHLISQVESEKAKNDYRKSNYC